MTDAGCESISPEKEKEDMMSCTSFEINRIEEAFSRLPRDEIKAVCSFNLCSLPTPPRLHLIYWRLQNQMTATEGRRPDLEKSELLFHTAVLLRARVEYPEEFAEVMAEWGRSQEEAR